MREQEPGCCCCFEGVTGTDCEVSDCSVPRLGCLRGFGSGRGPELRQHIKRSLFFFLLPYLIVIIALVTKLLLLLLSKDGHDVSREVEALVGRIHPGVVEDLEDGQALGLVLHEHGGYEVPDGLRDAFPGALLEVELLIHDVVDRLLRVHTQERNVAGQDDVEDNAQGPNVHFVVVFLHLDDLRREKSQGALEGLTRMVHLKHRGEPKVDYLDLEGHLLLLRGP